MFDQTLQPPSPLETVLELRSIFELGQCVLAQPLLKTAPKGDGHPVLVLPGFLVGDSSTIPLRSYLNALGYASVPWQLGQNLGYFSRRLDHLVSQVTSLSDECGREVSLIGWSLGGIYAREIARAAPDRVRQVITLGTPFARSLTASNIRGLYEWISGNKAKNVDPELFAQIQNPPPVPTTAIYTLTDGIVNWQTTQEQVENHIVQNIAVSGSHCGLGHNPEVLWVIADRLSQVKEGWQPFDFKNPLRPPADLLKETRQKLNQSLELLEAILARQNVGV